MPPPLPITPAEFQRMFARCAPRRLHDGETLGVKYNPNHKWKYVRGMEPDEFVLIKWYVFMHFVRLLMLY